VLDRVLQAWELAGRSFTQPHGPASAEDLAAAEERLGVSLDPELRALYERSGPGEYAEGNLFVFAPLPDGEDDAALANAGELLRTWAWPAPEEAVVFATSGAESYFGVWSAGGRPLVLEIGEVFDEPAALAVVGADVGRFLAGWTAYYLAAAGGPDEALDALGVPAGLRDEDPEMDDLLRWASREVADSERLLTVDEVRALASRA